MNDAGLTVFPTGRTSTLVRFPPITSATTHCLMRLTYWSPPAAGEVKTTSSITPTQRG